MLNAQETEKAIKQIPFPAGMVDTAEYLRLRAVYGTAVSDIERKFKTWLREEYAVDLPPGVHDMLWVKAFADGYSSGYSNIEHHYSELADFASSLFHLGRASR